MKKIAAVIGGAVLLFTFIGAAQAQSAAPKVAKKPPIAKAAPKAMAKKPAVATAPAAQPKKVPSGTKVIYVKPWYANILVLFFGGSLLFLLGGIIGRVLSFGPIPRGEAAEEDEEETERENWLQRLISKVRRPKPAAV